MHTHTHNTATEQTLGVTRSLRLAPHHLQLLLEHACVCVHVWGRQISALFKHGAGRVTEAVTNVTLKLLHGGAIKTKQKLLWGCSVEEANAAAEISTVDCYQLIVYSLGQCTGALSSTVIYYVWAGKRLSIAPSAEETTFFLRMGMMQAGPHGCMLLCQL